MRGRSAVVLVVVLAVSVVLMLSGCSGGTAGASSGSSGKNALVGEWVGANGGGVKFTEDVFFTNAKDETAARYRYAIIDGTALTLTRIATKNGVEFDDTANSRTEHYNVKNDTLNMESYGSGYFRVGSPEATKAIKEAPEREACGKARMALESGIPNAYPDGRPQLIDDAVIKKVLAEGGLLNVTAATLKCPRGGTFTWEGEGSKNLICSIHGK